MKEREVRRLKKEKLQIEESKAAESGRQRNNEKQ